MGTDQALARAALIKRRDGLAPTREESRALARVEKAREEELRWEYYRAIPAKHWRTMSGRQTKVIHDQAARYGLPIGGPTIDLPAVVRGLHDFLAANARKLAAGGVDDPALAGVTNLDRKREEDWKTARLKRHILEGAYLPRADVHTGLTRFASRIRRAGEALQRNYGPDALKILDDALTDAQIEIDNLVSDDAAGDEPRGH